ncbi:MAG: glycosyltransferase family 4 protein, partial [Bacteroidota bacterium]
KFDAVYIYRDAFFFGTFFESAIKKKGIPILYDFDDAIWLMDRNPKQGIFNLLKKPEKTAEIIALSDLVITGNTYLAEYAKKFNTDVRIIPSTIDFEVYKVLSKKASDKICIGWTGSFSTLKHFETVVPALVAIKNQFRDHVSFKVIGDATYANEQLGIQGIPWNAETEVEDLMELDIGIMPLPDNPWTRGKCAMKGLQYMALGIPTVMSPVGINIDLIKDGENGFLAGSSEEWIRKLSLLLKDPDLRKKVGAAGKNTVKGDFSRDANKDKWLNAFRSLEKEH